MFLPQLQHVDPREDVRNLHITDSRLRSGAGTCFVEYVVVGSGCTR